MELPGATDAPSGMGTPDPEPDGETDVVRPLRILLVEDHEPTQAVLDLIGIVRAQRLLAASQLARHSDLINRMI